MIKTLELENVLPFRKRVSLNLADRGLVLVRAVNRVSASADSNGSGKTSIVHGISVALFGEDLDGYKADAWACRFTEETATARVVLVDALGEWSVTRARRPASLTTEGIDGVLENDDASELQRKIEARLGFGVRTFRNAVVFGQGAFDRFALADQAEQMRMFDEIQGVDLRPALENARRWRGDLAQKLSVVDAAVAAAQTRRVDLVRSAAALRAQGESFEEQKRARVAAAEARVASVQDQVDAAEAQKKVMEVMSADLDTAREGAESVAAQERAVADARSARDDARDASEDTESDLRDARAAMDDLVELGTCPRCGQSTKQRARLVKVFGPTITAAEKKAKAAAKLLAASEDVLAAATEELGHRVKKHNAAWGGDAAAFIAEAESLLSARAVAQRAATEAALRKTLTLCRGELDCERRATWSGAKALEQAESAVVALDKQTAEAAERRGKLADALALADYWVEAFGDRGIRSMLVDGVVDYFNERAAAHLEALTAGEASLTLSATRELKKGGSRERLTFASEWAWGGKDRGSGGQDRRKDLAVFGAIQDLAESRSARPFPLKVYDEPFDALDARGRELACRWAKEESRARGTVLLVTHSDEVAAIAEPDVVWTVVMDRDGARVEES